MHDQFTSDGIVLDNALMFWVHRVYQAARNMTYEAFREHGVELTPEQWAVLVRLWECDGRTQNELCESTFRDKPTMSRMVDGMAQRGLVERRADPGDGRARRVFLTPEARALKRVLVPVVRRLVGDMLRGLEPADLETTRRTLRRVFENLGG